MPYDKHLSPAVIFRIHSALPEDALTFLAQHEWGDATLRYQVSDYGRILRDMPAANIATLHVRHQLTGVMLFWKKQMLIKEKAHCGVYFSGLTVLPSERNKGYGKALVFETQNFIQREMSKPIFYAHVDAENGSSQRVFTSAGFSAIAPFSTLALIHPHPQSSPQAAPISENKIEIVRNHLKRRCAPYAFFDLESLFRSRYWGYSGGTSELVAGLQVQDRCYRLEKGDFRFLKIGNIFYQSGQIAAWYRLLESVLAHYGRSVANCNLDPRDPMYQDIIAQLPAGFTKQVATGLLLLAHCPGEPEVLLDLNVPLVISPTDE